MRAGPALPPSWIVPDWPAPVRVHAFITTRAGGVSQGAWGAGQGGGMNLGSASDDAEAVARNRAALRDWLPADPVWMHQVHGDRVVDAAAQHEMPTADAAFVTRPRVVCCVRVADCLPVLLADARGRAVGAAHAGWRGLAAGVVQQTVRALRAALGEPDARLLAYLGPAIGPRRFEVGAEVRDAMRRTLPRADEAFVAAPGDKYLADLYALARQALAQERVDAVYGGGWCTYSDPDRFYSFRRDGTTGRHAALIWRD